MATDLKNLLSSASDSVTINKPTFTDAVDIAAAAVSGKGHLASAIASEGLEMVSPAAADHFSAAVRGGDLRVGAVGAIVGAVKPASKHDADSLAVMANLATNPGAAAIGYAAVQLGGDHIGDRGVGALKVGTALAGLAAGAPPLLAAWGFMKAAASSSMPSRITNRHRMAPKRLLQPHIKFLRTLRTLFRGTTMSRPLKKLRNTTTA